MALLLASAAAGCQAPTQPGGPIDVVLHVSDVEAFVDSAMTTLRECNFSIKRADRTHGRIVTEPETSAQWYEFWREDAPGAYQTLESSLHTIQRIVTVQLTPVGETAAQSGPPASQVGGAAATRPQGGDYRLSVHVEKQRYAAPQRQVTTASGALAIYSEKIPTREGLRNARVAGAHWVPLERDGLLEAYLLAKLAENSVGAAPVE